MSQNPEHELRQKLEAEVDSVPWSDLVRHYAFGRVYRVRAPWNLLDAGLALHLDAKELVQEAIRQKHLEQPQDEDVRSWLEQNTLFDVLIISPFVLIQVKDENSHRG